MTAFLAADDGIWQGNFDLADLFFLIATVLAVLATILYTRWTEPNHTRWAPVSLSAAVACASFGWLVL